jgi:hypothetical protein
MSMGGMVNNGALTFNRIDAFADGGGLRWRRSPADVLVDLMVLWPVRLARGLGLMSMHCIAPCP